MPRVKRALPEAAPKEAERIAKVIARAGLGSRREIEDWVTDGRVSVNGIVLTSPAFTVTPEDQIVVDGEPLPERERTRLFLYHKPPGVVTTNRDPEGRTTLFELLPTSLPRLVSVGRLDLTSEGLLLLTNDGGLARVLELPDTGWLRRYRVRAKGLVNQVQLDGLIRGITVEGIEYGPVEAVLDRVQGSNCWITVSLREGKNREVRNVLGALGLTVNRLIRVSYGPFQLGDVPEGGIEEVRTRILRDQLGDEIAAAAGADFDGPLFEREPEEAPRPAPRAAASDEGRAVRRPGARAEDGARGVRRPSMREEDPERAVAASPRSRRQADTREVVKAGTVADRRGREIKVERKITPPGEERGPRRPRSDTPEGERGFDARRGAGFDGPARGRDVRGDGPKRSFRSEGAGDRPRSGPGGGRFSRDDAPRGNREDRPRTGRTEGDDRPKRPFRADSAGERPRSGPGGPRFSRDDAPRGARPDAPRRGPPREGGPEHRARGLPEGVDRSDNSPWRDDAQSRPARPRPPREEGERPRGDRPARFEKPAGARPARAPGGAGGFRSDRPDRGDRPERSERTERTPRPAGAKPMGRSGPRGGKDVGFGGGERSERPRSTGGKPGGFKSGGSRDGGPSKGGGFKSGPPRGKGGGKPSGPRTRG
ncbi:pseudouridine synthase [Azorhizobium sp. AG788]|uniref:pseudouridine synthase n=1 Tax=Azorhizobium sp. AG788 TaxID=2183897 RepID=UPI0031398D48